MGQSHDSEDGGYSSGHSGKVQVNNVMPFLPRGAERPSRARGYSPRVHVRLYHSTILLYNPLPGYCMKEATRPLWCGVQGGWGRTATTGVYSPPRALVKFKLFVQILVDMAQHAGACGVGRWRPPAPAACSRPELPNTAPTRQDQAARAYMSYK